MSVYPQFAQQLPPTQQPQQFAQAPAYPPAQQPQWQQPQWQQPQQQWPQAPSQPPAPPLATGTLDDFYAQPSTSGGPSISWKDAAINTTVVGLVTRDVTSADVQQETNPQGMPQFYRDGRPKFVLKLPLQVNPSPAHPDGQATLFVKGALRDELQRAMSAAGVDGAPRGGAVIQVTLTGRKPSRTPGFNASNQFHVVYQPGDGTQPQQAVPQPAQQPSQTQQAVPQPQQPAQPLQQPQALPQPLQAVAQPAQPLQQAVPDQTQPSAATMAGFSPEQQALFARLAGGQA